MNDLEFWKQEGYLIKEGLISDDLIESYEKLWLSTHSELDNNGNSIIKNYTGWDRYDIYKEHNEILDIFCGSNIPKVLESIIGEPAGIHLNFTGWISTQKTWHQDVTVPNKEMADYYIGVWIALDAIDVNSGPFELIPKSHLWNTDFEKIYPDFQRQRSKDDSLKVSDIYGFEEETNLPREEDPGAAAYRYYSSKLEQEKPEGISFTANKGDVIFWHGHTVHRGSEPLDKSLLRKSIIGHYSGVNTGMLAASYAKPYKNGYYF